MKWKTQKSDSNPWPSYYNKAYEMIPAGFVVVLADLAAKGFL